VQAVLEEQDIKKAVDEQQAHSSAIGSLKVLLKNHFSPVSLIAAIPEIVLVFLSDPKCELERRWWP